MEPDIWDWASNLFDDQELLAKARAHKEHPSIWDQARFYSASMKKLIAYLTGTDPESDTDDDSSDLSELRFASAFFFICISFGKDCVLIWCLPPIPQLG